MTEWSDKKVLVLGLCETGLSLARWLSAQGARVRVADSREQPPSLAVLRAQLPQVEVCCGAFRAELLAGVDLIAISPGVPLADPLVAQAAARGIPVLGDIELFAQHINNSPLPLSPTLSREGRGDKREERPLILAITGSNGKTTVTSMVGAMCRRAGLDTAVAGNISPAVLDVALERGGRQPEVWVLELSSFQLESTVTLNADAATVLNISEDHLDRYPGMAEYAAAKARIFRGSGTQVLNRDDARSLGMGLPGRAQTTFGLNAPPAESDWGIVCDSGGIWLVEGGRRLLNAKELRVAGLHNVANALAALALCRAVGLPLSPLLGALRDFEGLPHRMEPVAEIGGVAYYDDSKGTNVGATVAALEGLGRPAVLIAGGEGKEQDFSPLHPAVARHARAVVLIGRDADRIAAALKGCGVAVMRAPDMAEAVRQGAALAKPGDAVLLSPACASFDMFRNYAHRAEVFVAAVHALQEEASCAPRA
ncbi:MAG: UDP-N-acetylmuramoyl-L-alanine--D-glutamate ligase [Nitrosomonadales bacterium]|nr:UDP-N-acetylmuramoyl-L-alanine--D-glutamate ligase [Nitrosomonadales bacterium]